MISICSWICGQISQVWCQASLTDEWRCLSSYVWQSYFLIPFILLSSHTIVALCIQRRFARVVIHHCLVYWQQPVKLYFLPTWWSCLDPPPDVFLTFRSLLYQPYSVVSMAQIIKNHCLHHCLFESVLVPCPHLLPTDLSFLEACFPPRCKAGRMLQAAVLRLLQPVESPGKASANKTERLLKSWSRAAVGCAGALLSLHVCVPLFFMYPDTYKGWMGMLIEVTEASHECIIL